MLLAALITNLVFCFFLLWNVNFNVQNLGTAKRELRSQLSEFTSLTVLKAENMTELTYFFRQHLDDSVSHAHCIVIASSNLHSASGANSSTLIKQSMHRLHVLTH
jgi:hypothetical protein